MTHPMSPEAIERLAQRRAGAKLGWMVHAAAYVAVNAFLLAISHHGWGNRPWSPGPLIGWGVGLALHGLSVALLGAGSGLRERMVQRERERLTREHGTLERQRHDG